MKDLCMKHKEVWVDEAVFRLFTAYRSTFLEFKVLEKSAVVRKTF